jgi:aspartate kinase
VLANAKINVDIILQSIGRDNTNDISFTVAKEDMDHTAEVLTENKELLGYDTLCITDKIAKVSVVGAGMMSAPGIAAMMFEALYDAKINIGMISTSEIKISVLVDDNDADRAVAAIHAKFFGA